MNTRKIVQIAIDPSTDGYHFPEIYALCSDGTLWSRGDKPGVEWRQLPPIPQATEPTTPRRQMAELTDAQLLKLAVIAGYEDIEPGEYEEPNGRAMEVYGSELVASMRAGIAADRAARPQPTTEALQTAYSEWFRANHLNNAPSQTAAQSAARFTMAVLLGEVEL